MTTEPDEIDPEIMAIAAVFNALKNLDPDGQSRVLDYVLRKLRRQGSDLQALAKEQKEQLLPPEQDESDATPAPTEPSKSSEQAHDDHGADESGINSVALKWMQRNGFTVASLGPFFSLGLDDIELVAKVIPGKNKKERLRSVALLKGVASYLSSGAARITHAELKETCLHYDAYDATNLAVNMKSFASEIAGSAKQGYSLTSRGLSAATELLKELASSNGS